MEPVQYLRRQSGGRRGVDIAVDDLQDLLRQTDQSLDVVLRPVERVLEYGDVPALWAKEVHAQIERPLENQYAVSRFGSGTLSGGGRLAVLVIAVGTVHRLGRAVLPATDVRQTVGELPFAVLTDYGSMLAVKCGRHRPCGYDKGLNHERPKHKRQNERHDDRIGGLTNAFAVARSRSRSRRRTSSRKLGQRSSSRSGSCRDAGCR